MAGRLLLLLRGRGINHALDIIKVDLINFLSAYASRVPSSEQTF